jgi:hypothetical protein
MYATAAGAGDHGWSTGQEGQTGDMRELQNRHVEITIE